MQGTGLISSLPYCRILNEIRRLRNRKNFDCDVETTKMARTTSQRHPEWWTSDFILQFIAAVIGNNWFLNEDQKNVKIVNEPVYLTGSFHCGRLTRLATSLGAVVWTAGLSQAIGLSGWSDYGSRWPSSGSSRHQINRERCVVSTAAARCRCTLFHGLLIIKSKWNETRSKHIIYSHLFTWQITN